MKNLIVCILIISLIFLVGGTGFAQTHFKAKLTGDQAGQTTNGTGTGAFTLTEEGLVFRITIDDLKGNFTAAHFHNAPAGESGGVVHGISDDFTGNTAQGEWAIPDSMIAELFSGNLYINVHTDSVPAGEIRGQIYLSGGTSLTASLTAEQETQAVTDSSGTGSGSFTLTDAGLAYYITVEGLTGNITAAHFHHAPLGKSGGVVHGITDNFDGNTANGLWAIPDSMIAELLAGNIYVNVHTAANGPGEIRGQVLVKGIAGFSASLDGEQEVHDVTTDATGSGAFTLTEEGLLFTITIEGLKGNLTAAHFHNAPDSMNGSVVRTITDDFDGNTASGLWRFDDDEPLTNDLIFELLEENLYINVHTDSVSAGEIRGQVEFPGETQFTAQFSGAQANNDTSTHATGTGVFEFNDEEGVSYHITVEGLVGNITAAHFHKGAAGNSGGVVRNINFDGNTASGSWTRSDTAQALTDELIADLLTGNLYVNVHTDSFPPGEIRGQVLLSGGNTGLRATFDSAQETHDVTTSATGTGSFMVTDGGVVFNITVEGLSGDISAAHFHHGAIGESGGVVRTITDDFDGNTAWGIWREDDTESLTDSLFAELLAGNFYVNIHTAANTAGEIRGQVNLSDGFGFTAALDGDQEVHEVTTDGMGTGAFTLTFEGVVFDITVSEMTGKLTAAHFHNAAQSVNGPVVRTITDDFDGNTATGVWGIEDPDDEDFDNEEVLSLLDGELYINVHTDTVAAGEVRGQIGPTGIITSVELTEIDNGIPKAFSLEQNYPNPFNPTTEIRFDINRPGHAVLKIFNVLGQVVATLVDDNLQAGSYKLSFDAANLPSGMYFYRLDINGFNQVKKMILLK